jgi:hypothetical protein
MARGRRAETDDAVYELQASICKAFANPIRLHMLDLFATGDYPVSALQDELVPRPSGSAVAAARARCDDRRSRNQEALSLFRRGFPSVRTPAAMSREVDGAALAMSADGPPTVRF